MEMKVRGWEPMVSNCKRGQGSSWIIALAIDEKGKVVPVHN
jgi:hypothetical protein